MMTYPPSARLVQPWHLLLLAALLLQPSPCVHASSYLSELEAEARSTNVDTENSSVTSKSPSNEGLAQGLPQGLTQEQFEQYLKQNYYGSYLFFAKLSEWNKRKVYDTYLESNDIEQVRNEIKNRMLK